MERKCSLKYSRSAKNYHSISAMRVTQQFEFQMVLFCIASFLYNNNSATLGHWLKLAEKCISNAGSRHTLH